MKQLYSLLLTAVIATVMCAFPSCSKDDDGPTGGKGNYGWFKADGKTTEFKYGYTIYDELYYSTIDILDMWKNPKKYENKKASVFMCEIDDTYFEACIDCYSKFLEDEGFLFINGKIYDGDDNSFSIKKEGSSITVTGNGILTDCWTIDSNMDEKDLGNATVDFNFTGNPKQISESDYPTRGIQVQEITDPEVIRFFKQMRQSIRK